MASYNMYKNMWTLADIAPLCTTGTIADVVLCGQLARFANSLLCTVPHSDHGQVIVYFMSSIGYAM